MVIFKSFENFCGFLFFALVGIGIAAVLVAAIIDFITRKMVSVKMDEYEELYKTNKDFKEYVDRYMRNKNMTLQHVLSLKLTQLVAEMYKEEPEPIETHICK